MNVETLPLEACPSCHSNSRVRPKLLLINAVSSTEAAQSPWRESCACGSFSVQNLKPEFATGSQFLQGLYCASCSIGYLPEAIARSPAPRYQPEPEGWRRILPDGTLGPLLQRISDDPELHVL